MVTTKHCCYGDCKSDSRTLLETSGIFFIGFGNGFPKPNKEPEKCKRWVQNCGRKYFSISNVNKDTYICSIHFVGGKGPTDEHPDPIKCGIEVVRPRKRPSLRPPYRSPKQQKLDRTDVAETLISMNESGRSSVQECDFMTPKDNLRHGAAATTSTIEKSTREVGVSCTVETTNKETQTSEAFSAENVKLRIQNKILENSIKVSSSSTTFLKKPTKNEKPSSSNTDKDCVISSHDILKFDDKTFKFHTGLTCSQFTCLWNFLGDCPYKMNYWNSQVSESDKTPNKRPGPKRSISPKNQLILTLMRLRLGLLHQDLAYRFNTNTRQVSTIVLTWVQLLFKQFSTIKNAMFASRMKIRKHLPKSFKKYKDIRCIIDCTEVHVQSPSNFQAQGNQYSSYKGYTSYKFLVAIAPNGAILYVSDAFEGSISDKEVVLQSGFLDFLEAGDVVMADRGFLIEDCLNERQVRLIRPPFLGSRPRFTPQEEALTKDIAKHRIHVERSIERMKKFKILQNTVPQSLQPVFSQMVFVIACLVNFQSPLVK